MVNDSEMGGFGFFLRQFYFIYMDIFGVSQAQMESISSKQLREVTRSSDALGKWRDVDAAGAVGRRLGREVFGHILTERTQKPGLRW